MPCSFVYMAKEASWSTQLRPKAWNSGCSKIQIGLLNSRTLCQKNPTAIQYMYGLPYYSWHSKKSLLRAYVMGTKSEWFYYVNAIRQICVSPRSQYVSMLVLVELAVCHLNTFSVLFSITSDAIYIGKSWGFYRQYTSNADKSLTDKNTQKVK